MIGKRRRRPVALKLDNIIKPVKVGFSVPQQALTDIRKPTGQGARSVRAILDGEPERPESGEITFVDNAVDSATGTLLLKGAFPNEDARLWPGQFVNVVLTLAVQSNAVVAPTQAIQTGQKGAYVFVVKSDQTVEHRAVTPGRSFNGDTVVSSGLSPGEQVVTDGQLRLIQGNRVTVPSTAGHDRVEQP